MSGEASGTGGKLDARAFIWGAAGVGLLAAAVNTTNVLTDIGMPGKTLLAPVIAEGSSWITVMLFCWIPWLALQVAPLSSRPVWRPIAAHAAGVLAYSAAHVGGFVLLRTLAFWLAGHAYRFGGLGAFVYELRKDMLGYVLIVAVFWIMPRAVRGEVAADASDAERMLVIRNGARTTRVKIGDILAIGSAGNYVELALDDGRKLLMRSSLSALETELAARGFLRTHRSWLVNVAHVASLAPEGSGDYAVRVGALTVPLSRRFPRALEALRAG
jgi:hypothetical protein